VLHQIEIISRANHSNRNRNLKISAAPESEVMHGDRLTHRSSIKTRLIGH